jgi:hypothetical protein
MGTATPKRAPEPVPVRCAGCRKTLAWTDAEQSLRNKMYCSLWCMEEPAVTPTEDRTDQWRILVASGMSPVAVSKIYGVAHSQVYTAIKK